MVDFVGAGSGAAGLFIGGGEGGFGGAGVVVFLGFPGGPGWGPVGGGLLSRHWCKTLVSFL